MTDGASEVFDLERTESNKALVYEFTKKILDVNEIIVRPIGQSG